MASTASYAQVARRQNAPDIETVLDFLTNYNLQKVVATIRKTEGRLASADAQEKFVLLVEACQVVGLL